jgi:tRNA threonylcarbamoyladenosine biosynthesis protein TsaB
MRMNLILNIETATEICSVALSNGEGIIDYRENSEGKSHASQLTVFIDEILKANQLKVEDLSAVAISMGPGSYTGLRIGVSAAKGLCYAHNTPLLAISTLQIMANQLIDLKGQHALNFPEHALLCPMIDARRHEVYTAMYDARGNIKAGIDAKIIDSSSFQIELNHAEVFFFGNGAAKCKALIVHPNARFIDGIYPSARFMAHLSAEALLHGKFEDIAYFEPFYLKDFVATTPKNKVIHTK